MRTRFILSPEQFRAIKALIDGPLVHGGFGEWHPEGNSNTPPIRTHTLRALFNRGWIQVCEVQKHGAQWVRIKQLGPLPADKIALLLGFFDRYEGKAPPSARFPELIQQLVDTLARHNEPLQRQQYFKPEEQRLAVDTHNVLVAARLKGFAPKQPTPTQ